MKEVYYIQQIFSGQVMQKCLFIVGPSKLPPLINIQCKNSQYAFQEVN